MNINEFNQKYNSKNWKYNNNIFPKRPCVDYCGVCSLPKGEVWLKKRNFYKYSQL